MMKRNLLLLGLATLLSACGFHLRGTGEMEFGLKEIDLSARNAYGDIARETRSSLEKSGVKVVSGAPYRLILVREQTTSRAVSYTSTARPAETELTDTLDYQIRSNSNLLLLSNQLEVQRSYVTDENNIAGASESAEQLRKEMRADMVQQLLSRVQMLTPQQLDALQEKAEAKAKAEAEAMEAARKAEAAEAAEQPESIQLPIPQLGE